MHWKRQYGKRTKYPIVCVTCGGDWLSDSPTGKYCSDACKGAHYQVKRCTLPSDHPVIVLIADAKRRALEKGWAAQRKPRPPRVEWRTARECPGCACMFSPLLTPRMLTCSKRCAGRVSRRRRRAAEVGAVGSYIWSDFMRVARRFDYRCAYCGDKPAAQLDPDHVVPLSRGGLNSTTNLLPSCCLCNADKRDLLLDEWSRDRERRGLSPRVTSWPSEDKRYWHLTQEVLRGVPAA